MRQRRAHRVRLRCPALVHRHGRAQPAGYIAPRPFQRRARRLCGAGRCQDRARLGHGLGVLAELAQRRRELAWLKRRDQRGRHLQRRFRVVVDQRAQGGGLAGAEKAFRRSERLRRQRSLVGARRDRRVQHRRVAAHGDIRQRGDRAGLLRIGEGVGTDRLLRTGDQRLGGAARSGIGAVQQAGQGGPGLRRPALAQHVRHGGQRLGALEHGVAARHRAGELPHRRQRLGRARVAGRRQLRRGLRLALQLGHIGALLDALRLGPALQVRVQRRPTVAVDAVEAARREVLAHALAQRLDFGGGLSLGLAAVEVHHGGAPPVGLGALRLVGRQRAARHRRVQVGVMRLQRAFHRRRACRVGRVDAGHGPVHRRRGVQHAGIVGGQVLGLDALLQFGPRLAAVGEGLPVIGGGEVAGDLVEHVLLQMRRLQLAERRVEAGGIVLVAVVDGGHVLAHGLVEHFQVGARAGHVIGAAVDRVAAAGGESHRPGRDRAVAQVGLAAGRRRRGGSSGGRIRRRRCGPLADPQIGELARRHAGLAAVQPHRFLADQRGCRRVRVGKQAQRAGRALLVRQVELAATQLAPQPAFEEPPVLRPEAGRALGALAGVEPVGHAVLARIGVDLLEQPAGARRRVLRPRVEAAFQPGRLGELVGRQAMAGRSAVENAAQPRRRHRHPRRAVLRLHRRVRQRCVLGQPAGRAGQRRLAALDRAKPFRRPVADRPGLVGEPRQPRRHAPFQAAVAARHGQKPVGQQRFGAVFAVGDDLAPLVGHHLRPAISPKPLNSVAPASTRPPQRARFAALRYSAARSCRREVRVVCTAWSLVSAKSASR